MPRENSTKQSELVMKPLKTPSWFGKRPVRVAFQVTITGCIIGFIATAVYQLMNQLDTQPVLLSQPFIVGVILALTYRVVNAYGWAVILNAMGDRVDGIAATKIWLLAESRRWLPGGVWGYTSRAAMAPQMGVSLTKASASMFLELLILIAAALVVSIPGIILYWADIASAIQEVTRNIPVAWIAVVVAAAALLTPFVWKRFGNKLQALQNRYESLKGISLKPVGLMKSVAFFVLMGAVNGLVSACLLKSIPGAIAAPVSVVIAATAVAWVVGFVAVFSPGGLIVREGTLALLLAPWLPYSAGFTLAILARLVQILAEVVCMLAVMAIEYRRQSVAASVQASS